jgi:hypothetical protein
MGRVVALVSGWNVARHRVASLAFVRIDDVWKGSGAVEGDVITLELPFGTFHHRGAMWCSEMTGSDRIAADRPMLVFGRFNQKPSALPFTGAGWPIDNDAALPPRGAQVPLETLRNSVHLDVKAIDVYFAVAAQN